MTTKAISAFFPKEYKEFIEYTVNYVEKYGKKIEIRDTNYLLYDKKSKDKCAGWCEDGDIVVAGRHPLAPQTYVHEFAHVTQFVEKIPLWFVDEIDDCLIPYIRGGVSHFADEGIKEFDKFYKLALLERDCERRSLKLINKFNLPIDKTDYTKKANLYLYFHQYIYLTRLWKNSTTIYKDNLLKIMPDKLITPKQMRFINMDIMEKFQEELR